MSTDICVASSGEGGESGSGLGELLHRALAEHDRILARQKADSQRKLVQEQKRHEQEVAGLRAEIAALSNGLSLKVAIPDAEKGIDPPLLELATFPRVDGHDGRSDTGVSDGRGDVRGNQRSPSKQASGAQKHLQKITRGKQIDDAPKSPLRKFVDRQLDFVVCLVIALNTLFLYVQLQINGQSIGAEEALTSGEPLSEDAKFGMFVAEVLFNFFFMVELIARMIVQKRNFVFHESHGGVEVLNIFDTFVVVGTSADLLLQLQNTGAGLINFSIFRPLRFLRLIRVLRAVNSVRILLKLRVLLATVACSLLALFWSIVLLFFTMLVAALFMNQAIAITIRDEHLSLETRQWLFRMYGTSSRAFYTVFEITFSGGWPTYARPLVEEVSPLWSCFFFIYIIVVVFAMFRIITALFLRDAMAMAANDAETAIQEKMHIQQGIREKLLAFFHHADTSGDGLLSQEEFEDMLEDPNVAAWLSLLELEVRDAMEVFDLVKQENNMVNATEFVKGMMRIKGQARSQDVFALLQNGKHLRRDIDRLGESLVDIQSTVRNLVTVGKNKV